MGELTEEYRQLIEDDFDSANMEYSYVSINVPEASQDDTITSIEQLITQHDVADVLELREVDFPKYGRREVALCRPGTPDIIMMLMHYGNLYGEFHPDVPKAFIVELLQHFQTTRPGFILEYVARNGHVYEPDMAEQNTGEYNWILVEVML